VKLLFQDPNFAEKSLKAKDLIKLSVYAMALNQDPSRPVLLLKDASGDHTLPVGLNPLEAGMALQQSNTQSPATPHRATELILQSLDLKIVKCVFVEIRGSYQYVHLHFKNHPGVKSLKVRADEAMSLCLHLNVPIYASKKMIQKSKELSSLEPIPADAQNPDPLLTRTHQYLL
jgi:uncharacterized protein